MDPCAHERDVILDSINEGVFTVDMDWRITAFNRAAERITGVPRKDAIGKACCDVFHASICENDCALRRTFEIGQSVINTTAQIVNGQGYRIPIRISTAILRDRAGKMIGGVETFQDLSQIRELQKELQSRYTFEDIIGRSPLMFRLFEILPQIAESSSTVLLEGPSGTGKELFASAIHNCIRGARNGLWPSTAPPFLIRCWKANCSAIRPGRSPTPGATRKADLHWPTAAPCS